LLQRVQQGRGNALARRTQSDCFVIKNAAHGTGTNTYDAIAIVII
jgi:hypothetical protein